MNEASSILDTWHLRITPMSPLPGDMCLQELNADEVVDDDPHDNYLPILPPSHMLSGSDETVANRR